VTSTLTFAALLAIALLIYWLWERSDQQREIVAQRVAADVRAMGDVVAQSLSPRIDPELCIGSGACVSACPETSVIALIGGRAELVNPLGCIGHGACATACPVNAIRLVYGTATRGVELPVVDAHFQTNQPGVYIAGELGGMGLIRNAIRQGRLAAEHIITGDRERGSAPRRGKNAALDALVVGAGPAGISATLQLMHAGLRVLLVDREGFGGTILHYPRAKLVMTGALELPVYGTVRGRQLSKEQLMALWHDIHAKLKPPLATGHLVTGLSVRADGMIEVQAERGVWHAANVVLALGGRGSPRKLDVPGEESAKVSYRLLEPSEFRGKHVMVVGGGNSAVESALALADFRGCASVSLSYRRKEFARCRRENRRRIQECSASGAVRTLLSTELLSVQERSVRLSDEQQRVFEVPNDALIVQAGGTPPAQLLQSFGIQMVTKYGES
jgi:thioredoxin reductase/NAD-dependent dihydropyrimidine dehydrogenase PreA subunit